VSDYDVQVAQASNWRSLRTGRTYGFGAGTTATMQIGARVAPFGVYNTVDLVEAQIGPLQIGRVFHDAGLPSSYSSTLADSGMAGMAPGSACIVSTKAITGTIAAYCQSIPPALTTAGKFYMSYHHEPENGDYATGAQFVSEYTTFRNAVKAANPLIKVGPIAITYSYGRGASTAARNGDYLPDVSLCDYYGADVYQPTCLPGQNLPAYTDWTHWYSLVAPRGKPVVIAEYGIYAEPNPLTGGGPPDAAQQANRALLIPQYIAYLRTLTATPCEAAVYWYVDGKAGEPGTFRPTDPASNQALANIVRAQ